MQYKRNLDFTDKTVFPVEAYTRKRDNLNVGIAKKLPRIPMDDETIIEYVSAEMKNTLG